MVRPASVRLGRANSGAGLPNNGETITPSLDEWAMPIARTTTRSANTPRGMANRFIIENELPRDWGVAAASGPAPGGAAGTPGAMEDRLMESQLLRDRG